MDQDRRSFLTLCSHLMGGAALGGGLMAASMSSSAQYVKPGSHQSRFNKAFDKSHDLMLSALDDHAGQHFVGVYDLTMEYWLARVKVSKRYHAATVRRFLTGTDAASLQFVFISRRPGDEVVVIEPNNHQVRLLKASEGRHFYGHAATDNVGRVWFTEHDYVNERALLVCRAGRYLEEQTSVIDLQGIGPHEVSFLADGKTAVVGLGGIKTHPDLPRKKLNIDTMDSECLLVDTQQGEVIYRDRPLDPQLSLRHLDCAANKVVIAAQYQGPSYLQFPLVYMKDSLSGLKAFDAPEAVWRSMNQYIASVQINSAQTEVLVSCPRSNAVHLFSLEKKQWLDEYRLADPGGISLDYQGRFLVSTGAGQIVCLVSKNGALRLEQKWQVSDTRWDNHMNRVSFS